MSSYGNDPARFTEGTAIRVLAATRLVESQGGSQPGRSGPAPLVPGEEGMLLCKTKAAWAKGSKQTVDVYSVSDQTPTGDTVEAVNLAADIESGKWCGVENGMLCWAEC